MNKIKYILLTVFTGLTATGLYSSSFHQIFDPMKNPQGVSISELYFIDGPNFLENDGIGQCYYDSVFNDGPSLKQCTNDCITVAVKSGFTLANATSYCGNNYQFYLDGLNDAAKIPLNIWSKDHKTSILNCSTITYKFPGSGIYCIGLFNEYINNPTSCGEWCLGLALNDSNDTQVSPNGSWATSGGYSDCQYRSTNTCNAISTSSDSYPNPYASFTCPNNLKPYIDSTVNDLVCR